MDNPFTPKVGGLKGPSLLANRLTPIMSPYLPPNEDGTRRKPTPKQAVFMLQDCKEAGYGGATGGGKSDALLMDACQFLHVPGYAAILFRRTFSDLALPGNLMDRAHDWFSGTPGARWRDREKTWEFRTEGKQCSTLTFGFMDTLKDRLRYKGSEVQYAGFDEGTQFEEAMYTFMFSRLRYSRALMESAERMGARVPLRLRLATNPGDIGHEWVKRRFINCRSQRCPIHPLYEGDTPAPDCSSCQEVESSRHRIWIPSGLKDNPHLDSVSYMEMLKELDPVTREQFINGNWDVIEGGGQFERIWFAGQIRKRKQVPTLVKIVRAWDLAGTKKTQINPDPDWTCGVLMGIDEKGNYWILDIRRIRETSEQVQDFVKQTAVEDLFKWGDGVEIWFEQEPGSAGKAVAQLYKAEVLPEFGPRFQKPTGKKEIRSRLLSAAAGAGRVFLLEGGYIPAFLDEAEMFPAGAHDDQIDPASLAVSKLRAGGNMSVGTPGMYALMQPGSAWDRIKSDTASGGHRIVVTEQPWKAQMGLAPITAPKAAPEPEDDDDGIHPATRAALNRARMFNADIGG